jgi:hypothetical protein
MASSRPPAFRIVTAATPRPLEARAAAPPQRRTKQADALIAGAYLAGTNTRRVRRALAALFGGAVGRTRSAEFGAR